MITKNLNLFFRCFRLVIILVGLAFFSWSVEGADTLPSRNPELKVKDPMEALGLSEPDYLRIPDSGAIRVRYIKTPKFNYVVPDEPLSEKQLALFNELSPEDVKVFTARRLAFLNEVAKQIAKGNGSVGTLIKIKNSLVALFKSKEKAQSPDSGKNIQLLGKGTTQKILQEIDRQIWMHAPIVAQADEFGVSVTAGGEVALAFQRKSLETLLQKNLFWRKAKPKEDDGESSKKKELGIRYRLETGASFGYRPKSESSTIGLVLDWERLKNIYYWHVGASLAGKVLFYAIRNSEAGDKRWDGHLIHNPVPPLLIDSPNLFMAGLSFGWGVPPFGSLNIFSTNHFTRFSLLKKVLEKDHFVSKAVGASVRGVQKASRGLASAVSASCQWILSKARKKPVVDDLAQGIP